jgi:hypothetical protein
VELLGIPIFLVRDLAEINFLATETEAPATGDHDGFIVEGIVDVRQASVGARGRLVDLRRTPHAQRFMRAFVVEDRSLRLSECPQTDSR